MKNIIAVISGKGGVGKSTVAVNLSIALAKLNHKVALIDGDFYGPSIPTLLGGGEIVPDHEGRLIPCEKHGVKYISLGFFLKNPDDAVLWRGPMFNKALTQMFQDVNWGEVDYCIVDMPPGTGDAQLSLAQLVQLAGAVVVTTPQEVALADVRKALNMLEKVNVPVLGIVENMSGFSTPSGEKFDIFGSGGGVELAQQFNTELLGQIPIDIRIRAGGDSGEPIAGQESAAEIQEHFRAIGLKIVSILDKKGAESAEVEIVS